MNVRPLHDRLIVQRLQECAQRTDAIIIPDSARQERRHGKVLPAAPGTSKKGS